MLNLGSLKSLLDALIALDGQLCADGLQNLYQHDQQRRGEELQHHIKAVVAVVDGNFARPPPMMPAMAPYPMMVVAAIVTLATRLGMLSGTMTLVIICSGVAPMLWAASMTPASTSRILVSTRRDTNGTMR